MLLLVYVPALAQHGDQTVHSTHTRLRRCRRPSGGAGAPAGGYDLRWEDMILQDQILEGQNWDPWEFSGPRTLKKDSPEKMLSNGTLESETGDICSPFHSPLPTSHPHPSPALVWLLNIRILLLLTCALSVNNVSARASSRPPQSSSAN